MSGSGPLRELTRNKKVEAAINNEYMTRQRVDRLEQEIKRHQDWLSDLAKETMVLGRPSILDRLRWLVTGR